MKVFIFSACFLGMNFDKIRGLIYCNATLVQNIFLSISYGYFKQNFKQNLCKF